MITTVRLWFLAFLLTVAIEVPLVVALTRDSRVPLSKRAALAFFAQLMTHPSVWFIFPALPWGTRHTTFVASELFAWLAEAAFYAVAGVAPSTLRAIAVAAVANGLSLGVGFFFF
jgi:hypothetical protein